MDIRPGRDSPRAAQIKTVVARVTSARAANELLVLIFARLTHMRDDDDDDKHEGREEEERVRRWLSGFDEEDDDLEMFAGLKRL